MTGDKAEAEEKNILLSIDGNLVAYRFFLIKITKNEEKQAFSPAVVGIPIIGKAGYPQGKIHENKSFPFLESSCCVFWGLS